MKIRWFPEELVGEPGTSVRRKLDQVLAKRGDLKLKVESFLKRVEDLDSLQSLYTSKQADSLDGGLDEFRIPKQAPSGVVRLYFCWSRTERKTLYILDVELKHQNKAHLEQARLHLKQYLEYEKRNKP
jgi:hypothetical protein